MELIPHKIYCLYDQRCPLSPQRKICWAKLDELGANYDTEREITLNPRYSVQNKVDMLLCHASHNRFKILLIPEHKLYSTLQSICPSIDDLVLKHGIKLMITKNYIAAICWQKSERKDDPH